MRILVLALLVLINFVLQSTLFPHIAIFGAIPDTALILIVSYAIMRNEIEGALFGLFAGLVQDLSSGLFIGIFALLGFLLGYVCGKPFKDFFKDNYFLPFMVVLLASTVHQFLLYVTTVMFTGQIEFWFYARAIILPTVVYTVSLSIPVYVLMHLINKKLEKHEANFNSLFKGRDEG